ncbi:MAG: hypothetical protein ACLU9S_13770 [Oscillospiraceae bacterium]
MAKLSEATAPPMKTHQRSAPMPIKLGGETVLFRHEKTLVNQATCFAVTRLHLHGRRCRIDAKLAEHAEGRLRAHRRADVRRVHHGLLRRMAIRPAST